MGRKKLGPNKAELARAERQARSDKIRADGDAAFASMREAFEIVTALAEEEPTDNEGYCRLCLAEMVDDGTSTADPRSGGVTGHIEACLWVRATKLVAKMKAAAL